MNAKGRRRQQREKRKAAHKAAQMQAQRADCGRRALVLAEACIRYKPLESAP